MNTRKKRKLHGSVLLTVVFVMSILIVFLFGTMALALAANNRAHVNYSSAQTGITARSVAESAVSALDKNVAGAKEYKAAVGALKSTDTPLQVKVGLSNPGGSDSLASMGNIDDVTISYAGTKKFYDETKEEWLERDLLKFTSNVTMSGVTSSASVYVLKQEADDKDTDEGGGAGFVTTAGAAFSTQTDVLGGAYIGLPTLDVAKNINYNSHEDFIDSFKTVDGSQNQILVAVDGSNSVELYNSDAILEADFYVCDNLYVNNWSGFIFPKESKGVTVWGDLYYNNNAVDHLNFTYHGKKDGLNFNQVPYVYVDGHIYGGEGKVRLGNANTDSDKQFPLNTFCGWIDSTHSQSILASNIYCMDSDKTSTISGANNTNLYIWSNSVVTKIKTASDKTVVNGEVCSKGNLNLENCVIAGDVRVEGNLKITGTVEVKGNVVVAGDIEGVENLKVAPGKYIYNDNVGGTSIEIPNAIGNYYKYIPAESIVGEGEDAKLKWVDPDGNPLHDGYVFNDGVFTYGAWIAGQQVTNPTDLDLYYTIRQPENEFDIVDINDPSNIDYGYGFKYGIDTDSLGLVDGSNNKFYAFTEMDEFTSETEYTLSVDYGIKVNEATFVHTYGAPQGYTTYLNNIGEKHVYPEYAERGVILGLETLKDDSGNPRSDIKVEDYQIVKTIEQILTDKNFKNPYDNKIDIAAGVMPSKILELSKELKDVDYITSPMDMEYDASENALKITKSCKLDVSGIGANIGDKGEFKKLIIDPGKNEIVIFVKNFSFNSARDTIIDDSQGGKVHIIIEKNGTFGGTNNSIIYTKSYAQMFKDYDGQALKFFSSSTTPGIDVSTILGNRIKPNLYIYGEEGSTLDLQNMGFVTANIISPDLKVTIGGTEDSWNTAAPLYYDDTELKDRPLLIGCLNAGDVDSKNIVDVLYSDNGKSGGGGAEDDDPFWYKILYYSEF